MKSGECIGCFYIESPAMRGLLTKLKCDNYVHLVAASRVTDVINYRLVSDSDARNRGLFGPERSKNLALPEGLNARTAELAGDLFDAANQDSRASSEQNNQSFIRMESLLVSPCSTERFSMGLLLPEREHSMRKSFKSTKLLEART